VRHEKLFETDVMTKPERVAATLNHQPVDRVALHEQLGYNPGVIEMYTGRKVEGFDYTADDACVVIRKTMDMAFPPASPRGTERFTNDEGFVYQNDNWATWHVSRPFDDEVGARDWLVKRTESLRDRPFDADAVREGWRGYMLGLQAKIGETVILDVSATGFCGVFDSMGLELFTFFHEDYPEVLAEYMELSTECEIRRVHAKADPQLSPVILIAEDFSTKQGPIFSPEFLWTHHYPYVKRLADAWREHGFKVLYHSDGNYRKAIPELIECGVDGFYCLEPNCGMHIVGLKNEWPEMVWAGGIDGVDLMERGTPEQVRQAVHRDIRETDALRTGGMFVASSSEINPPIKPENFKAMVDAVGELTNPDFHK